MCAPREPDVGLSSGALRAPELKTASGTPARFARRLRRKIFLICVSIFLCLGSQFLIIFLQIFVILGSEFSYSAFSYRVSEVYFFSVLRSPIRLTFWTPPPLAKIDGQNRQHRAEKWAKLWRASRAGARKGVRGETMKQTTMFLIFLV